MIRWHKLLLTASVGAVATLAACGGDDTGAIDAPHADASQIDASGTAALAVSPLTADFGSVVIGQPSAAKTFTITNTGTAPTGSINAVVTGGASSDYALTANTCTATLAAGAMCTVGVTFTPSAAGTRSVTLSVSADPGGTVSGSLTGTGSTAGMLSISTGALSFASTVVGSTTATQTFTVTNSGAGPTGALTVAPSGVNPGDFTETDTCNGQTLAAAATCTLTVAFAPTTKGARANSYTVSATPGGSVIGAVTGTGLAQAALSLNNSQFNFGSVIQGQSSGNVSVIVTNTGDVASGSITNSISGTNSADFIIGSSTCAGSTLAAGASCTVNLHLTAGTPGNENGVLSVAATPGGNAQASLLGISVSAGSLSITPSPFAFVSTVVNSASTSQLFTVTNTGGSSTGTLSSALGGTDPSQFQIVAGTNACAGVTLAAGATCTVAVTFNPTVGGTHNAALTVAGSPGGSAQAALSGVAVTAAQLTISPLSNDYGSVTVGTMTAAKSYTITNTGDQTSSAVTVVLGGTNSTQFTISANSCSGTLASNATCAVSVLFSPTTPGSDSATLTASATTGGSAVADLFGVGNDSDLTVSPGALDFNALIGPTDIGDSATSAATVITLKNTGSTATGTLVFNAPTGTNPTDFSQTNTCPADLAGGASCTLTVKFTPGTTEACVADKVTGLCTRTASFSVTSSPGGTVSFAVTGTAQPRVQVEENNATPNDILSSWPTDTFDFGGVAAGTTAAASHTFFAFNNTTAAITIDATTTLTGVTSPYAITNNTCGVSVAIGGSCQVTISFKPTVKGVAALSNAVTFSVHGQTGAANSSALSLTGTGTDSLGLNCGTAGVQTGIGTCTNTPSVSYAFNSTPLGQISSQATFTITEPSGAPATGTIQSSASGPFHVLTDNCAGNPFSTTGGSCTILVAFAPTATGAGTGTLTVEGNPGGTITASLSGNGQGAASLSLSKTSVAFGNVFAGESSSTTGENGDQTITVSNAANLATSAPVTFSGIAAPYSILTGQTSDCTSGTTTLAGGASCNIRIHYKPTNVTFVTPATVDNATLNVSATGGNGGLASTNIAITGTSVSDISISPSTFSFPTVDSGNTATQVFTVTNNSNSSVGNFSTPLVAVPTSSISGLSVITSTCSTVASKGTCALTVQFSSPTGGTTDDADLNVTADNLTTPTTTGAGKATTEIKAVGRTAAHFVLSPTPYNFGDTLEGQTGATEAFTLTNTGGSTGTVGTVNFTTGQSTEWTLGTNTCGTTVAGGGSCTIQATFKPAVTGNGSLRQTHLNAGGTSATLQGVGIIAGGVTASPGSIDFGTSVQGTATANQTITVQNTAAASSATLNTGTALLNSPDFNVVTASSSCSTLAGNQLAAGANCTYVVNFQPSTGNNTFLSAALTVTGGTTAELNGTGLSASTLSLAAGGFTPCTQCSGTNFNSEALNVATTASTITIENFGNVTSGTITVALSGADSGEFAIQNNTCTTLAAQATCSFGLVFKPITVGPKNATLNVSAPVGQGGAALTNVAFNGTAVSESLLGITPSTGVTGLSTPVGKAVLVTPFTISNGGGVTTGALSISLSNSTDFSVDVGGCVASVTNGVVTGNTIGPSPGSCPLFITFDPQSQATGLTTTLTVSETHDGVLSTVSNTITGNGTSALTEPSPVTSAASPFSFANETAPVPGTSSGTSTDQVFQFTNTSSVTTGPLTTSLGGTNGTTDYAILSDSCEGETLATGISCFVDVSFEPQTTGTKTATLTVSGTPGNSASGFMTGKGI